MISINNITFHPTIKKKTPKRTSVQLDWQFDVDESEEDETQHIANIRIDVWDYGHPECEGKLNLNLGFSM